MLSLDLFTVLINSVLECIGPRAFYIQDVHFKPYWQAGVLQVYTPCSFFSLAFFSHPWFQSQDRALESAQPGGWGVFGGGGSLLEPAKLSTASPQGDRLWCRRSWRLQTTSLVCLFTLLTNRDRLFIHAISKADSSQNRWLRAQRRKYYIHSTPPTPHLLSFVKLFWRGCFFFCTRTFFSGDG